MHNNQYEQDGYECHRQIIAQSELQKIRGIAEKFHANWKVENEQFYLEKAINSAYLTSKQYLSEAERLEMFKLIGSTTISTILNRIFPQSYAFMNTQLFFDPFNQGQNNYWHRDSQYHLDLEEQKAALAGPEVIHVRIPLYPEAGIELIPRSHRQWDTPEMQNIRLEQAGRRCYEPAPDGKAIALQPGDALFFSANMIHRGIYGQGRLALDILYCEPETSLLKYSNPECFPTNDQAESCENSAVFFCAQPFFSE